jgi:hypothetical protein
MLQARCKRVPFMTDTKSRQSLHLPPSIRARYEERLALCQRAWETTGDPLAVAEAITWAHHYRQPTEEWLEAAAVQALIKVRSKAQAKRYRDGMIGLDRYTFIRDVVAGGFRQEIPEDGGKVRVLSIPATWEQAIQAAAEHFGVDEETVWKSYKKVKRQFRERRTSRFRYWTLKDVRYRDLGYAHAFSWETYHAQKSEDRRRQRRLGRRRYRQRDQPHRGTSSVSLSNRCIRRCCS